MRYQDFMRQLGPQLADLKALVNIDQPTQQTLEALYMTRVTTSGRCQANLTPARHNHYSPQAGPEEL